MKVSLILVNKKFEEFETLINTITQPCSSDLNQCHKV